MTQQQYTIAVIGAGPAALYASEVLAGEGHRVVILNRDIKPGGLAEFGIYPTKHKMKNGLRRYFQRILEEDNVHYRGNVTVGVDADISLQQVRQMGFDATVVAVGAQGTKWLGLPGEGADAVYHAKDLVYHYNDLPPYSERDYPVGQRVAVVGLGNVCLDIVNWMTCYQRVDSVTAVARRGPAERKFTAKEYKIVSGALDVEALNDEIDRVAPAMEAIGQDPEKHHQKLVRFVDEPLETESDTRFRMRFLRSPERIELDEQGQVVGLVCEKTRLLPPEEDSERVGIERLGEYETIDCDTVVFAIGDAVEPGLGLPLSPAGRDMFATVPQPWDEHPDRPRYMAFDPEAEEPLWDTFLVGWARKASDGLVGKARRDAVRGCDEILAYLNGEFPVEPAGNTPFDVVLERLEELFEERELAVVRYPDVQRLEEIEQREAKQRDVEEFKFSSEDEMLRRIGIGAR